MVRKLQDYNVEDLVGVRTPRMAQRINEVLQDGSSNLVIEAIDTRNPNPILSLLDERIEKAHKMGDLIIEDTTCISGCNPYSCTFTYNPSAKFSITETYDAYIEYEALVVLKDPKKITRTRQFGNFSFMDQYRIFNRHFKRWLKDLNGVLDKKDKIRGYQVYIEKTKQGTLHAHSVIFTPCNYIDGFSGIAGTLWSRIAKGHVRAMKGAFDQVHNMGQWNKYIQKDMELNIFDI